MFQIMNMPRQSGKTTTLLKLVAKDPNGVYVTVDYRLAQGAKDIANTLGIGSKLKNKIFSVHDIIDGKHRATISNPVVYIDELEFCLREFVHSKLGVCTNTLDEFEVYHQHLNKRSV